MLLAKSAGMIAEEYRNLLQPEVERDLKQVMEEVRAVFVAKGSESELVLK